MSIQDKPHTLAADLYALSKEFSRLCDDVASEHISFEDYNNILEYETKLNAYGNLLSVTDTTTFLRAEIDDAESYLASLRQRRGLSGGNQEETK